MSVTAAIATTADELEAVFALRHAVFVVEQQVPPDVERDEADATAVHILGRVAGVPAATARLVLAPHATGVIGRVAVVPALRGSGVGVAVMRFVHEHARAIGLRTVELHAQAAVRAFYDRLGYTAYGEEFWEAGIRHIAMRLTLGSESDVGPVTP